MLPLLLRLRAVKKSADIYETLKNNGKCPDK